MKITLPMEKAIVNSPDVTYGVFTDFHVRSFATVSSLRSFATVLRYGLLGTLFEFKNIAGFDIQPHGRSGVGCKTV